MEPSMYIYLPTGVYSRNSQISRAMTTVPMANLGMPATLPARSVNDLASLPVPTICAPSVYQNAMP